MKLSRMILLCGLAGLLTVTLTSDAQAQRRSTRQAGGGGQGMQPSVDLTAMYGHMWGGHIDVANPNTSGTLRLATNNSWFFAVDVPVGPGRFVELSYDRQDTQLNFQERLGSTDTLTDLSVNYWQVGVLQGMPRGSLFPYFSASLGLTYYSFEDGTVDFGGETYGVGATTRFSFTLGLGLKKFFGQAERIGIRASFKTLATFYDTNAGVWFGTSGGGLTFGGSAIWQWEAAVGLTLRVG